MLDRSSSHTVREQFPAKLYTLLALADLPGEGCSGAAGWLSHGRAFRIRDEAAFMKVAVPMFFRQTKFRSFCRQLNLWGYRRVLSGFDTGAWYHAHFLRERPGEMRRMIRVKIKGSKTNGGEASSGRRRVVDPDFYSMPPLPALGPEGEGSVAASAPPGCGGMQGAMLPFAGGGTRGGGAAADPAAGQDPQRRVTLERAGSAVALRFGGRNINRNPNGGAFDQRGLQRPGSPCSIVPPPPPNPRGCNGPFGRRTRDAPYLGQDGAMGGLDQTTGDMAPSCSCPLARRSKTATKAEAPSDEEMAWIKQRLVAGVAPLPFGIARRPSIVPTPPSPIDIGAFSSEDQAKRALTAGLEPLPFKSDLEPDEFANYIDNVIQMV